MTIIEGIIKVMIIICISILTTTITGSIALIFGCGLQKRLEEKGYFKLIRVIYLIILMLYTVPIIPIISYVKHELLKPTKYMLISMGINSEVKSKPIIFTYSTIGGILLTIVGAIIIIGVIKTFKYSFNYVKLLKKYTNQCYACDVRTKIIFDNCKRRLGIKRNISVYNSYKIFSPMICGVVHPAIYLPEKNYSDVELETIFIHEMVHHLHRDIFIKHWIFCVTNVHWFNPIVKNLITYMNDYSEKHCDIVAGSRLGMQEYLQQLLNIAQYSNDKIIKQNFDKMIASLSSKNSNLLDRAQNMECFTKIKKSKRYSGVMVILASVFIVFNCANVYAVDVVVTNGYKILTENTIISGDINDDINYQKWTKSVKDFYYQDIIDGGVDNTIFALETNEKYDMPTPISFDIKCISENEDQVKYKISFSVAEGDIVEPILVTDPRVNFKIGIIEPSGRKRYIYNSNNMISDMKYSFGINQMGLYSIFLETDNNFLENNIEMVNSYCKNYSNLGSWIIQPIE